MGLWNWKWYFEWCSIFDFLAPRPCLPFVPFLMPQTPMQCFLLRKKVQKKYGRCKQDSNLRGETPLDFKSNALTTRPSQLLLQRVISRTSMKEFHAANEPDLSNTAFFSGTELGGVLTATSSNQSFCTDVSETLTMTETLNLDISKPENWEQLWPGCLLAKNEE